MYACEIDWSDRNARHLIGYHLNRFGVLLIRNFFPPELASDLDAAIGRRFDQAHPDDLTPGNPEDMWPRVLEDDFFLRLFRYCRTCGFIDEIECFLRDEALSVIEATVSIRQVKPKPVTSESFGWHRRMSFSQPVIFGRAAACL